MPVTSMVRLARLDLTSTDPIGFRAAVRLPAAIKPLRDRVRLRIAVKLATGKEETQDFRLTELSDPAELSIFAQRDRSRYETICLWARPGGSRAAHGVS